MGKWLLKQVCMVHHRMGKEVRHEFLDQLQGCELHHPISAPIKQVYKERLRMGMVDLR